MILEIILSVLIILVFMDYYKKTRINKIFQASGVAGPKFTFPLIGDIFKAVGINVKDSMQFVESLRLQYGKVSRVWCFNKCLLFVQDVKYFEAILSRPSIIKKNFFYEQLALWLGDGLVMSSGIKWQKRRKIFTPAFHIKILEQFVEVFNQHAQRLVEKLYRQADGLSAIDITHLASSTALDILLETAMGVKSSDESENGLAYINALENLSCIAAERFVNPLKHNDLILKTLFYKSYCSFKNNAKVLHNFTEKIIEKRRAELLRMKTSGVNDDLNEMNIKKRTTFLDILLQATIDEKPLKNEDIREEVDTFTFGGHDTVTIALSYVLYLISRHPQVQQKLFKEILNIIGPDKTEAISMKKLQELKYLECVIKEAMRLYPPGPVIGRQAEEDYKFGDKIIPRNTNMILLIYAVARDPEYFSSPNDFIPERFSLYNRETINPYASVPFSAGLRSCIGQKYAMLEIKTIVCWMLRNFELLHMGPDVDRIITLVLRSTTGVHLGLKHREY